MRNEGRSNPMKKGGKKGMFKITDLDHGSCRNWAVAEEAENT